jgi:hypothetical protein
MRRFVEGKVKDKYSDVKKTTVEYIENYHFGTNLKNIT